MTTEEQRQAAPTSANTMKITEGKSNGWSLIYCKGPGATASKMAPFSRAFSSMNGTSALE